MAGSDMLMRIDDAGRVIECSPLACELFGWDAADVAGRSVGALLDGAVVEGARHRPGCGGADSMLVRSVPAGSSTVWEVRAAAGAVSKQDLAILRAMFTQSSVGLHVLDDRLRIVRVTTATRGLRDVPAESLVGRVFSEAFRLMAPEEEEKTAREVLASGRPVLNRLVRSLVGAVGRRPRVYSVSYARLESEGGEVLGLIVSTVDVTERERALQRLETLEHVRACVGERLEVVAVCEELAGAVVPAFSGIVVVEVIEDVVRGEEPPLAPVDRDIPLRRAAFRGLRSAYPVGEVRKLPYGTPFSRVLTDLRPRLVPVEPDSIWLEADASRAESIQRSCAHSLIVAPLSVRGEALGVVSFYRYREEEPFDEADVALASDICAHAALCVENARRYTRERTIAATVKRRLLPQQPATPSTVAISHLHIPGPGGGGAWFDVIELAGARTALILGDVSGRGMDTATTMGQLRTALHSLAALDLEPDELMARLSDTAARLAEEREALPSADPLHRVPLAAGCLIVVYDSVEQKCAIVRAGHPKPLAVLPDGSAATMCVSAGPVLAGKGSAPFPATAVSLPPGSTIVMINEDLPVPLGPLLETGARRPLGDLCDALAYALRDANDKEKMVLLARIEALPADQVLTCPLPAEPRAAPLARAAVRRQLETWKIDEETAFTTELIASELVGNAIRYGASPIRLRLILDRQLTCEVSDTASSAPHLKHARTIDENGRGLFIIANLADNWGTRYYADEKTVWAQQTVGAN
ncbi:SpoIIE family protein phosphatase [Streptomyces sp. NPDC007148]|uniref:SpoIIE family protein phosphatase n=1 Tax=Streptomyces sp. NPDC007148 TaxID=3364775 RepID=UPI0036B5980B